MLKILGDRRLLVAAGIVLFLIIGVNSYLEDYLDEDKLHTVMGRFSRLERIDARSSVSYNIYLTTEADFFKVGADYVECFNSYKFNHNVKFGDLLTIGMAKSDGPFRDGSVAFVKKEDEYFMKVDCRNKLLKKSKGTTPLLSLTAIAFAVGIIIWMTKNKKY